MKKVAIITARGGSKGLVDKNMLMVYGKPLLAYSIENALDAGVFDEVILTTDSDEYIEMLSHYPVTMHRRPDCLASDTAATFGAIEECILSRKLNEKFDYFIQFQPTTPYRLVSQTIDVCRQFEAKSDDFDFLASVTLSSKPSVLQGVLDEKGGMSDWDIDYSNYRRQNYPAEYVANGVYYGAKIDAYLEQKHFYGARSMAYIMDKTHSIDIDDRNDFEYFYFLLSQDKRENILHEQVLRDVERLKPSLIQASDITLIGDSFFALCPANLLHNRTIQNLSVSSISTKEYPSIVLSSCSIIADTVYISIGRDDLRKQRCKPEQLVEQTLEVIRAIKRINPNADIYLFELVKTHFRVDCDNRLWEEFNPLMAKAVDIMSRVHYIKLNDKLCNNYGKLSIEYTIDGYNLNAEAYELCLNATYNS